MQIPAFKLMKFAEAKFVSKLKKKEKNSYSYFRINKTHHWDDWGMTAPLAACLGYVTAKVPPDSSSAPFISVL